MFWGSVRLLYLYVCLQGLYKGIAKVIVTAMHLETKTVQNTPFKFFNILMSDVK